MTARRITSPLTTRGAPPLLLGAHTSAAGGVPEAPPRAAAVRATAMQIFTKMGNRWAERDCAEDECIAFRQRLAETAVAATMAHDSYLINLASPDPVLRARSTASFTAELRRCAALGLDYLVSHPGNFMDEREAGLARNAECINEAFAAAPGSTILCLETTAGSGTALGATFEELATIISLVDPAWQHRIGICLDSCHVYSAGYDLVGDYDGVFARLDDVMGLHRLKVMHLNDSKTPFSSRKDRHELIAEGSLGALPFRRIMNDPRLATVPKVIETPKLEDHTATDTRMLELLRSYIE